MTLRLVDTGVYLALAFEDPGCAECGELLDHAYRGDFDVLMSAVQMVELLTPFLRARDLKGAGRMEEAVASLDPRVREVDEVIARKAAELRSTLHTPQGRWLALADSIILSTALVEGADSLCTTDTDFAEVKEIRVEAPGMDLGKWVRRHGTARQKRALGKS